MKPCRLCGQGAVAAWLDLGPQPISNRFPATPDEAEARYPLGVGGCPACGTVQLQAPVPADELRPRCDWITYNEPEGHLDALADVILRLPGVTAQSTVGGITVYDELVQRRLRARGLAHTWTAEPAGELGITAPFAGVETVQQQLTPDTAERVAARHGRADVVLLRRVFEHAQEPHRALAALRGLVRPGGYLVVEVPDALRALERCDYSTIWEEHVFYFTPFTLLHGLARAGWEIVAFRSFPYRLEDALVAIVRPAERAGAGTGPALNDEVRRAERFLRAFPQRRDRFRRYFADYHRDGGKIAFLGAGHMTCGLINYFGLTPWIAFVADDHPRKQGRYLPGARLPIRPTAALADEGVDLCCMGIRPEAEPRVMENQRPFREAGGRLASIFPDSPFALAV